MGLHPILFISRPFRAGIWFCLFERLARTIRIGASRSGTTAQTARIGSALLSPGWGSTAILLISRPFRAGIWFCWFELVRASRSGTTAQTARIGSALLSPGWGSTAILLVSRPFRARIWLCWFELVRASRSDHPHWGVFRMGLHRHPVRITLRPVPFRACIWIRSRTHFDLCHSLLSHLFPFVLFTRTESFAPFTHYSRTSSNTPPKASLGAHILEYSVPQILFLVLKN